jgi:hypothetical protein
LLLLLLLAAIPRVRYKMWIRGAVESFKVRTMKMERR